jgi:hypothetical protein
VPRTPGSHGVPTDYSMSTLSSVRVHAARRARSRVRASYRHGQAFASQFGAEPTTAAIWPLIVDGLLKPWPGTPLT